MGHSRMLTSKNRKISLENSSIGLHSGLDRSKVPKPKILKFKNILYEMQFRITLVRHGEAAGNKNHRVLTFTDEALNETGKEQASMLGKHLKNDKFTKVYTSHLMRTYHTAEGILASNENPVPNVVQDPRLTEKNLSEALEGTCGNEFWKTVGASNMDILKYLPPGGETYEAIRDRAAGFFQDLCKQCSETSTLEGDHVLIVSHGLLILHLLDYFYTEPSISLLDGNDEPTKEETFRRAIGNTAFSNLEVIQVTPSNWKVRLLSFNDMTHLGSG